MFVVLMWLFWKYIKNFICDLISQVC